MRIDRFEGKYYFLSNFYECPITYKGLTFTNTEAAFHAQKNEYRAREFCYLNPSQSKQLGRKVQLRPDWEDVKYDVMYEICKAKFEQHPDLKEQLLATGDAYLEEGNTWNDRCWGVCNGVGENNLGKILMRIRNEFRY